MNMKVFSFLIVIMFFTFASTFVSANDRFDITDISYSYVSYNHPYYPNGQYYNNYNTYAYGYNAGYVNPYNGYISYPVYNNYVTSYYPVYTYPRYTYYNNTVSYVSPQTNVTFSWQ